MCIHAIHPTTRAVPRPSRITRRGLLGAAASLVAARAARAQDAGSSDTAPPPTRAGRWVEAEQVGVARFQPVDGVAPDPITFAAPFPFTGVAPHWSGKERPGATVEVSLSPDGADWTDPIVVGEDADAGRPGRDHRRYGPLIATTPASWVRYRTFDADGNPAALRGLAWEYIDAATEPAADAAQEATPTAGVGFAVFSRAEWGADEALRFDNGWEVWPPEYAPVSHVIVHHSDTANYEDPLAAIRSIYYYHAVTRGWGDVGYNYLVDFLGNVYEGRFGGENAVGGHALGYNEGTCGICLMGRFAGEEPTPEMLGGLAGVLARVTAAAGLDPFGASPLNDIPNLPTIAAHRDVNPTSCPGDLLYADLGVLREQAVAARAGDSFTASSRFGAGDAAASTEAGVVLREGPGLDFPAITTLAADEPLTVADGPATNDGLVWYQVRGRSLTGWVAQDYLVAIAPAGDPGAAVGGPSGDGASSAQVAGWASGAIVAVVVDDLLLRGAVLRSLPEGAWLEIIGPPEPARGALWYPVDTGLGVSGWVSGDYLRLA